MLTYIIQLDLNNFWTVEDFILSDICKSNNRPSKNVIFGQQNSILSKPGELEQIFMEVSNSWAEKFQMPQFFPFIDTLGFDPSSTWTQVPLQSHLHDCNSELQLASKCKRTKKSQFDQQEKHIH